MMWFTAESWARRVCAMTLSIDLNEQLQARLEEEARRQGVQPTEYARRVLEQRLLAPRASDDNRATLDLPPRGIASGRRTMMPRTEIASLRNSSAR
jgi:hypothetical protein